MSTRPPARHQTSGLSIIPPSPTVPSNVSSPTKLNQNLLSSPRGSPLPPSPTYSTNGPTFPTAPHGPPTGVGPQYGYGLGERSESHRGDTREYRDRPWVEERSRSSIDVPRPYTDSGPPPVPSKISRLPTPTLITSQTSPHRPGKGSFAGAYDNKLVSSTLSQLPPLPPLSPTPTGTSHMSSREYSQAGSSSRLHPASGPSSYTTSPRPGFAAPASSSSGLVVLPNGTALATSPNDRSISNQSTSTGSAGAGGGGMEGMSGTGGMGRTLMETMAHSSPNSPWSLMTVHVLPLFAGGHLKTPIEDLNQLCHSHIIATSQRAQPARIVALLTSDLREFVASGMLTLKAKFETLEESKIVARASEVWSFFWAQVLPYLEGVFLPFTQVRDLPSTHSHSSYSNSPPIPVRNLLLSGFLLQILLPLLPRLSPLLTQPSSYAAVQPTSTDLQRLLQMSLVLSTQARYSTFFPDQSQRDYSVRESVDGLGKAVRWRIQRMKAPTSIPTPTRDTATPLPSKERVTTDARDYSGDTVLAPQNRTSLQKGPSIRYRRRGWRASSNYGHTWGQVDNPNSEAPFSNTATGANSSMGTTAGGALVPNRQMSESTVGGATDQRWGRPRMDLEEEDEDDTTPGQSLAYPRNTVREDDYNYITQGSGISGITLGSTAPSTLTGSVSTFRGGEDYQPGTHQGAVYQRLGPSQTAGPAGAATVSGTAGATLGAALENPMRRPNRTESSGSSEVHGMDNRRR